MHDSIYEDYQHHDHEGCVALAVQYSHALCIMRPVLSRIPTPHRQRPVYTDVKQAGAVQLWLTIPVHIKNCKAIATKQMLILQESGDY